MHIRNGRATPITAASNLQATSESTSSSKRRRLLGVVALGLLALLILSVYPSNRAAKPLVASVAVDGQAHSGNVDGAEEPFPRAQFGVRTLERKHHVNVSLLPDYTKRSLIVDDELKLVFCYVPGNPISKAFVQAMVSRALITHCTESAQEIATWSKEHSLAARSDEEIDQVLNSGSYVRTMFVWSPLEAVLYHFLDEMIPTTFESGVQTVEEWKQLDVPYRPRLNGLGKPMMTLEQYVTSLERLIHQQRKRLAKQSQTALQNDAQNDVQSSWERRFRLQSHQCGVSVPGHTETVVQYDYTASAATVLNKMSAVRGIVPTALAEYLDCMPKDLLKKVSDLPMIEYWNGIYADKVIGLFGEDSRQLKLKSPPVLQYLWGR